jgi:hypothetical protein
MAAQGDQGHLSARHAACGDHHAAGRRLGRPVIRDHVRCPRGRHDGRRGQQGGAGEREQGGCSVPGRGTRMRSRRGRGVRT